MSIDKFSNAVLYGRGVFTTLAIRDREPLLWDKHWRRLVRDAGKLGLDLAGHTEPGTRAAIDELIREERLGDGRVRVTFIDRSASAMWPGDGGRGTDLLIVAGPKRPRPEHLELTLSPRLVNSTSPLAGVKSCNYLEPLMAYEEARALGFDEGLRLNERGHVASACMANIFWETGGKLYTPSLSTGCLAGTTREYLLERLEVSEVESGVGAVGESERIFLTSANLGVASVVGYNGRKLDTSDHPLLRLIT